jgi:hypothetical protein
MNKTKHKEPASKGWQFWIMAIVFFIVLIFLTKNSFGADVDFTFFFESESGTEGKYYVWQGASKVDSGSLTELPQGKLTAWGGSWTPSVSGYVTLHGYVVKGIDTIIAGIFQNTFITDSIFAILDTLQEYETRIDSLLAALSDASIGDKVWVDASSRLLSGNVTFADGYLTTAKFGSGFLTGSLIGAGALNGKGDWPVGKTGYSISGSKTTLDAMKDFDYATQKVTLVDSSAEDISYTANNPDDYKGSSAVPDSTLGDVSLLVNNHPAVSISGTKSELDDLNDFDPATDKVTLVDSSAASISLTVKMVDSLIIFQTFRSGASADMGYSVDYDTLKIMDQNGTLWMRWIQRHIGQTPGYYPDSAYVLPE